MSNISYNRFVHELLCGEGHGDEDAVSRYLAFIASSFQSRTLRLPKNFPLWRAQCATGTREHEQYGEILGPCDEQRMIPDPSKVGHGRANPEGEAYLYTATNELTAIHEIRPWIGEHVSLGLFVVREDQEIINCSEFHGRSDFEPLLENITLSDAGEWQFQELSETQLLKREWISIDKAFSRPIPHNEPRSRYIPTQRIAMFIKAQGYKGIVYKSVFADGFNIVLFDVSSANLRRCTLVEITDLRVSFNDTGEAYTLDRGA